jgi:hypothetical protein
MKQIFCLFLILTTSACLKNFEQSSNFSDAYIVTKANTFIITRRINNEIIYQGTSKLFTGLAIKDNIFTFEITQRGEKITKQEDKELKIESNLEEDLLDKNKEVLATQDKNTKTLETITSTITTSADKKLKGILRNQDGRTQDRELVSTKKVQFTTTITGVSGCNDMDSCILVVPFDSIYHIEVEALSKKTSKLIIYLKHMPLRKEFPDVLTISMSYQFRPEHGLQDYVKNIVSRFDPQKGNTVEEIHNLVSELRENYTNLARNVSSFKEKKRNKGICLKRILFLKARSKMLRLLNEKVLTVKRKFDQYVADIEEKALEEKDFGFSKEDRKTLNMYSSFFLQEAINNKDNISHFKTYLNYYVENLALRAAYKGRMNGLSKKKKSEIEGIIGIQKNILDNIILINELCYIKEYQMDYKALKFNEFKDVINKFITLINEEVESFFYLNNLNNIKLLY